MKIGVVLVTFNRLDALKHTLEAYEKQTFLPEFVLVIDNASTDGTQKYLQEWEKDSSQFEHKVLLLDENEGGSGGFHVGMAEALRLKCDWIFAADDDAVPQQDMLYRLMRFSQNYPQEMKSVAALCASVKSGDNYVTGHRRRISRGILGYWEPVVSAKEYKKECFRIDIYSFVGSMIRREALEKAGLPRKDFFIYQDDVEHALRIGKTGKILCVPSSVIYHVDNVDAQTKKASWRDYYMTRNCVITYYKCFGKYAGGLRSARRFVAGLLSFNREKIKLICTAISDGYQGKTGLHVVYKPGWNPNK